MTRMPTTRARATVRLLLVLAMPIACTPGPVAAPSSPAVDAKVIAPLPVPCDDDPATCAERQRKRDEMLRPARERVHPAGVTPPTIPPRPEQ